MKKNIVLIIASLVALAACEKPVPYEPGVQMDVNGPNVYFSNYYNSSSVVVGADETGFEVAVLRSDATNALSVPLKGSCGYEGMFEYPETIEFAAGVDSVGITIKISDKFEMFKTYPLVLSVPQEYTHAYAVQDEVPTLSLNVLQEDYLPYAEGIFVDYFWSGEMWDAVLEYSAIQDKYRLSNAWGPVGDGGADLVFAWDKDATVELTAGSYSTGIYHSSYGYITAVYENSSYGVIPADYLGEELEGFTFNFKWTVSAGSFGSYPEFFIIEQTL